MLGLYAGSPRSVSCFHRLRHDEVWHVYGGDPSMLTLLHPDGRGEQVRMGTNPLAGEQVQCVVPAGVWQAGCLVPGGLHALFGCTMAPGFTGDCFEAGELATRFPAFAETIHRRAHPVAGSTCLPHSRPEDRLRYSHRCAGSSVH